MSLPWVRLDSNISGHDKILALICEKDGYRAAFSYVSALGYSGGHDTDGLITFSSLTFVHGTRKTAGLLVTHHLWRPDPLGWRIVNYEKRQPSSAETRQRRNAQRAGALRTNCKRWHAEGCRCWEEAEGVA